MMKFFILVALIGFAASAPPRSGDDRDITIIRSEVENNGDGSYSYRYETSDGTIVEEKGYLKAPLPGTEEPIQVAEGSYQYVDKTTGELIRVTYTADEGGFKAEGAHLPTPPPIPPEIQRALEIIYRNAGQQIQPPKPQPPRPRPGASRG